VGKMVHILKWEFRDVTPVHHGHQVGNRHHCYPVRQWGPSAAVGTLAPKAFPTIITTSHSQVRKLRRPGRHKQGRALALLLREGHERVEWENWCPVACYLYYWRGEETAIRKLCLGSCRACWETQMVEPDAQPVPPSLLVGTRPTDQPCRSAKHASILRKGEWEHPWVHNMMAPEEMHGPQPLFGRFFFSWEINGAVFSNEENAKQLRKLYPCFLPQYTSLCFCINFIMAKCHSTAGHA
jgi:hypothetical protein